MLVVTPLFVALEKLQMVLIHSQVDLVAHSEETCTKTAQFIPIHSIKCTNTLNLS